MEKGCSSEIKRLNYHFEPQKGWINDPNGLIHYKGKYHAFFQHYPYAPKWGQMHWGHAVSEDLIHWQELPIALYPDQPYENRGGCFSGSAIEKDGKLYLFYTSVSHETDQTQSVAVSEDGVTFTKYADNPIIRQNPVGSNKDFRDPKVTRIGGRYYMVVGSGFDSIGRVLLFVSDDLLEWSFVSVLVEGAEYGFVIECPDLFPLGDQYVLMFSQGGKKAFATMFCCGDFDGSRFHIRSKQVIEAGPDFYAPQTFQAPDGRRILMAWLYRWDKPLMAGADFAGALTIPRELRLENGRLISFPVREAAGLLSDRDPNVRVEGDKLRLIDREGLITEFTVEGGIRGLSVLRDTKTVEVFVNGGEFSASFWYAK